MNHNGVVKTAAWRSLDYTLDKLRQRYGPTIITKLGHQPPPVAVISTGFPVLDQALGVGGLPRGRIVDIYGPESSGKTTLCLHVIAQAQALPSLDADGRRASLCPPVCAFIDTEHALDPAYAAKCGVDLTRLYLAQPDSGEEALEIAEVMVRGGAAVVVIDSAAALVPRAEIEGEMGDNHHGLQARLMSQAMRKLAGPVRQNNTLLIFTNQLRCRPNTFLDDSQGPTGGMALRFHASVAIDLRRVQAIKSNGEMVGCRIRATVKKNKLAPPFRSAELDLIW